MSSLVHDMLYFTGKPPLFNVVQNDRFMKIRFKVHHEYFQMLSEILLRKKVFLIKLFWLQGREGFLYVRPYVFFPSNWEDINSERDENSEPYFELLNDLEFL